MQGQRDQRLLLFVTFCTAVEFQRCCHQNQRTPARSSGHRETTCALVRMGRVLGPSMTYLSTPHRMQPSLPLAPGVETELRRASLCTPHATVLLRGWSSQSKWHLRADHTTGMPLDQALRYRTLLATTEVAPCLLFKHCTWLDPKDQQMKQKAHHDQYARFQEFQRVELCAFNG